MLRAAVTNKLASMEGGSQPRVSVHNFLYQYKRKSKKASIEGKEAPRIP